MGASCSLYIWAQVSTVPSLPFDFLTHCDLAISLRMVHSMPTAKSAGEAGGDNAQCNVKIRRPTWSFITLDFAGCNS